MQATTNYLAAMYLGLASILTLGCSDSTGPGRTTGPARTATGVIEITVSTTGVTTDLDPDGYSLRVDDRVYQNVSINARVTIRDLAKGRHLIELDGLASKCSVSGGASWWVHVDPDIAPSRLSFDVSCGDEEDSGAGDWDY